MKKRVFCLLVAVLCLSMVLAGCNAGPQGGAQTEKLKVGFVFVGTAGDAGWTYAHNQGRLHLEEKLNVQTFFQENVSESDSVAVMQSFIDQGCKVIFATSFGYMDYMLDMAQEYPDIKFLHCSGYKDAENMLNYFGRMYQPRYLSGIVAGMKTQSNKIGYVAAFPIPEVIRGINAFTQGVRSVNPDATVEVVWTFTWYDPATEKSAAVALLDKGIDVVAQHQDTAGPQQAAQERGVWAVGYNSPTLHLAPKSYMTAPVWNWGPYYVDQVQKVMNGTWKSENYWGGMKDGIIDLAPLSENAPEGAQAKVDEMKAKIINGEFDVFYGPIKDQAGNIKVPQGSALSDGEMLSMMWFVEGVIGNIPQN